MNGATEGLTVADFEIQKLGLLDRINRLEHDLQNPMSADSSEQAGEISNLIILRNLLEVERKNLIKINFEIEKRKQLFK